MARADTELYRYAKQYGYKCLGMSGTTHWLYQHPETEVYVRIPSSPSSQGLVRKIRDDIRKGAPQEMQARPPRQRPRKRRRLPREVREAQRQRAAYLKRVEEIERVNEQAKLLNQAAERRRNGLPSTGQEDNRKGTTE